MQADIMAVPAVHVVCAIVAVAAATTEAPDFDLREMKGWAGG